MYHLLTPQLLHNEIALHSAQFVVICFRGSLDELQAIWYLKLKRPRKQNMLNKATKIIY